MSPESPAAQGPLRIHIEGDQRPRSVELDPAVETLVGRDANATIRLTHDAVSRRHMTLFCRGGQWFAQDLGSRHGSIVDGALLAAGRPVPFGHASTIAVRPFLLRAEFASMGSGARTSTANDQSSVVKPVVADEMSHLNGMRLNLLMETADAINLARDERGVAKAATDALLAGTGFARALMLRGYGDFESLETLAVKSSPDQVAAPSGRISRTLLREAAKGTLVRLEDQTALQEAHSIVGAGVAAALCAPVIVPPAVEAFLYLDSQRRSARPSSDAAAFCNLVARLAGLALANIRRLTAEDRQRELEAELGAARSAQRRLMPADSGSHEGVQWHLFSRPGQVVAGDIAGMYRHDRGLVLFAGDVRGKGVDAAIVMATIGSHLVACLRQGMALDKAVAQTNNYVHAHRRDESDFASLWVAEIDARTRLLRTVDAGHGWALLRRAGGAHVHDSAGGSVLGVMPDAVYGVSETPIGPGERLVIFTDGLVEQCGGANGAMLGIDRVSQTLLKSDSCRQDVESLLTLLRDHAGADTYKDDVTIVSLALE